MRAGHQAPALARWHTAPRAPRTPSPLSLTLHSHTATPAIHNMMACADPAQRTRQHAAPAAAGHRGRAVGAAPAGAAVRGGLAGCVRWRGFWCRHVYVARFFFLRHRTYAVLVCVRCTGHMHSFSYHDPPKSTALLNHPELSLTPPIPPTPSSLPPTWPGNVLGLAPRPGLAAALLAWQGAQLWALREQARRGPRCVMRRGGRSVHAWHHAQPHMDVTFWDRRALADGSVASDKLSCARFYLPGAALTRTPHAPPLTPFTHTQVRGAAMDAAPALRLPPPRAAAPHGH